MGVVATGTTLAVALAGIGVAGADDATTTLKLDKPSHACRNIDRMWVTVTLHNAHRNGTFQLAAYGANFDPYGTTTFRIKGTSYHHRLAIDLTTNGDLPKGRTTIYFTLYRHLTGDANLQFTNIHPHKTLPHCT